MRTQIATSNSLAVIFPQGEFYRKRSRKFYNVFASQGKLIKFPTFSKKSLW